MRVGAMFALVRVLSPPNVAQSLGFAAGAAAPRCAPPAPRPAAAPPPRPCWLTATETDAIIAVVRNRVENSLFIVPKRIGRKPVSVAGIFAIAAPAVFPGPR